MRHSLRGKMLLAFGGFILLVSITLCVTGVLLMYRELWRAQQARLEDGADRVAQEVAGALTHSKNQLLYIAGGREVKDFPINYRTLALKGYLARFQNQFLRLSYVNEEGYEEAWAGVHPDGNDAASFSKDPLFLQARENRGAVIAGPVRNSPEYKQPVVRLGLGLWQYFGDTFVGALIGTVPLGQITSAISPQRLGAGGQVLLLDDQGRLLYGPDKWLMKTLEIEKGGGELFGAGLAANPRFGRATLLGRDCLVATTPLQEKGWTAVTILPYSEFFDGPRRLIEVSLGVLVLVCLIGGLISYLLATRITSSLSRLSEAVYRYGQGQRRPEIDISGDDEVALLARAFRQMTQDLSATTVSRNYLDNLLGAMKEALFVVDLDGMVLTVNPAACTLLGYDAEELEGRPVAQIFCEDRENSTSWFARLASSCGVRIDTEWRSSEGRRIPVALSCTPLFGTSGRIDAVICVAEEIAEGSRLEEQPHPSDQVPVDLEEIS